MSSMKDCPCHEETPDPCPMCGATVSGNDPVNGVCQAGTIRGERDKMLSLLRRWTALDAGSWHATRYAVEKADLLSDTRKAIALTPPQDRDAS